MKKLQSLGWGSIIVLDDVNKRATFCMKEFNGLCSTLQYSFIYTALGKDYTKVYDDLEDVRRASSPFFKMNSRATNLYAECLCIAKKMKINSPEE